MLEQIEQVAENSVLVYDALLESKTIMQSVNKQGQVMYKAMKQYQLAGFSQEQAFQLVLAQVADFKVQIN
jgi:hypothetical protein